MMSIPPISGESLDILYEILSMHFLAFQLCNWDVPRQCWPFSTDWLPEFAPRYCQRELLESQRFLSWSWTLELSPPKYGPPHVTTDPSSRIAANANVVLLICFTLLSWSLTLKSLEISHQPHWTTEPSSRMAANEICFRPESASHSWADLELQSCHHQIRLPG